MSINNSINYDSNNLEINKNNELKDAKKHINTIK